MRPPALPSRGKGRADSAESARHPCAETPLGQGPLKQCQHPLTTLPGQAAVPAVLAIQARIDAALTGQHGTVRGQPAAPAVIRGARPSPQVEFQRTVPSRAGFSPEALA